MDNGFKPSLKEEIANSVTHGIGVVLSIIALIVLICKSASKGTSSHIVCCSFYGSCLLLLYTNSTLYHAITHKTAKNVFRRLDHISIYLLIFGTYVPLALIVLNNGFGRMLFGIECACCVAGITFKAVFGPKLPIVSALFYLFMGWIAIFAVKPIYITISWEGVFWIIFGGIFYTLGIIFFATDRKVPYFHAVWHIFVLLGSFCHFIAISRYVIS